jgi:hypothetical protein
MPKASEAVTVVQQQRLDAIRGEGCERRLYTYAVGGKTIVGQFRRYLQRQDAGCIGNALYEFLTVACSFIAEMGLVPPDGGFRIVWAEPADMIDALSEQTRYMPARRGEVSRVYADGMTDVEILQALDELCAAHRRSCALGRQDRKFNHEISALLSLAEAHCFTIVPPGWRLGEPSEMVDQAPAGSLAAKLSELAARNGQTLIAPPPGPELSGQTRLL